MKLLESRLNIAKKNSRQNTLPFVVLRFCRIASKDRQFDNRSKRCINKELLNNLHLVVVPNIALKLIVTVV